MNGPSDVPADAGKADADLFDDDVVRAAEVERKYDLPDDTEPPELDELGPTAPPRTDVLVAEYHDTPRLDLLGARITLRRRSGGDDAGWHLKTPGSGDTRHELRVPLARGRRVPAQIRDEIAEVVGDQSLLPVVRIETVRTTSELFGDDGAARATIVLDHVEADVLRDDVDVSESWSEVEVELAAGEPESTFDAIEPLLLDAGLRRSASASKLARILGDVPPRRPPGRHDTAADVAVTALAQHYGRFQSLESAIAVDAPDAVHQARIALRRMRSILQVFRRTLHRSDAARLREELRWAGERLGGARDAEVLREEFTDLLDGLTESELVGPIRDRIFSTLDTRHAHALARAHAALKSPRWDALHVLATEFIVEAPQSRRGERPAEATLGKLALDAIDKVAARRSVAEARPHDLDSWHDVRKSAKAVRYAHEVLAGIDVRGADDVRATWKQVASVFGEVQDSVILGEQLEAFEAAADDADEPLDTYDMLRARLERKRADDLARARTLVADAVRDAE